MELSDVVDAQLAFHGIVVGFVIILAVLVFVFGFKTAEEPPFDKLTCSTDDRKPAGKKRKVKDKKSQSNGLANTVVNEKSEPKQKASEIAGGKTNKPVKDEKREIEKFNAKESAKLGKVDKKPQKSDVVVKPALKDNKNIKEYKNELKPVKKQEQTDKDLKNPKNKNKGKENVAVEVKNKKNSEKGQKSKKMEEKPQDYDEGEWEQASYRKDRKKTRVVSAEEDSPGDKNADERKEVSSPGKNKTKKLTLTSTVESSTAEFIENEKKTVKKDANKKEKKNTQQSENVAEFLSSEIGEDKVTPKKSEKKKILKNNTESILPVECAVLVAPVTASEVTTKVLESEGNLAVFDDFADSCPEKWKEPKTSKKSNSRKKVRKDQ